MNPIKTHNEPGHVETHNPKPQVNKPSIDFGGVHKFGWSSEKLGSNGIGCINKL